MFNVLSNQGNANQNNSEFPYYIQKIKKLKWQHMLAMWSKGNSSSLLVGVQTYTTTLDINLAAFRKLEIALPEDPAIPLLDIYPKDASLFHKDICSAMFTAVLFLIACN